MWKKVKSTGDKDFIKFFILMGETHYNVNIYGNSNKERGSKPRSNVDNASFFEKLLSAQFLNQQKLENKFNCTIFQKVISESCVKCKNAQTTLLLSWLVLIIKKYEYNLFKILVFNATNKQKSFCSHD